jgi:hypothetical protein
MRPSSLPFTRILPIDEPQDPPLMGESGVGTDFHSPASGLRRASSRRPQVPDRPDNEPGMSSVYHLSTSSSPGIAGRHHPATSPCAVPSAGITRASSQQAPAENPVRSTRAADGPLPETPPF